MVYLSKRLLHRPPLIILGLALLAAVPAYAADNSTAAPEERLRKDVFYLASDALEGRGPTTKGIDLAADYIAAEFKKAGLRPGGVDGAYFQPFPYPANVLDEPARLTLKGPKGQEIELKQGVQFNPMGLGRAGKLTAPVVFAGYGITSAAAKYDDYDGIDATDKVVVVLRDSPHSLNEETTCSISTSPPWGGSRRRATCRPSTSADPCSKLCSRLTPPPNWPTWNARSIKTLRHRVWS